MRKIFSIVFAFAACSIASAEDRSLIREVIPLDPNSADIVGQFHRIGFPKYTEIEIGKSVFEYPGLIAMGTIRHDEDAKIPYTLTIGIRPHISEFAESFGEHRIEFDANGIVQSKSKVHYSWDKNLK